MFRQFNFRGRRVFTIILYAAMTIVSLALFCQGEFISLISFKAGEFLMALHNQNFGHC